MPLAGSMKLRTFLLLAGGGTVLLIGGGLAAFTVFGVPAIEAQAERAREQAEADAQADRERVAQIRELAEQRRKERDALAAEEQRLEAERRAANPLVGEVESLVGGVGAGAPVDVPTGRYVDDVLVGLLGSPLGSSKRKDVTAGSPSKVNVYQDDGNSVANRAKVDLDRDDQWDEKWTFSDGVITRKVAPGDDENYTVEEVWQQGAWVPR